MQKHFIGKEFREEFIGIGVFYIKGSWEECVGGGIASKREDCSISITRREGEE